ncbi:disulfide bond formation protein B [Pelagibacterales bacterium]|jgi:disulfide bond formation protein DsbB|nr:disulfide bond formation protein B [Pelagibacterales bacterium]|tara:strand:+ start:1898 stop:2380 length:483 start_codon:yes stop_codon:yes gene_type:complete
MSIILNKYILVNLVASFLILLTVYILQYFFNMAPCDMCIKERYPYYIIGILAVINIFIDSHQILKTLIIKLLFIATSFFGFLYSIYHVGIERKFWTGRTECSGQNTALDIEALSAQLMNTPIIRCDEATLLFNLISIAELNVVAMTLLLILNAFVLYKKI